MGLLWTWSIFGDSTVAQINVSAKNNFLSQEKFIEMETNVFFHVDNPTNQLKCSTLPGSTPPPAHLRGVQGTLQQGNLSPAQLSLLYFPSCNYVCNEGFHGQIYTWIYLFYVRFNTDDSYWYYIHAL